MNQKIKIYLVSRRLELKLSQKGFAKKLGVSYSIYSKVESGNRMPSKDMIIKLKNENPIIDTNIFFES